PLAPYIAFDCARILRVSSSMFNVRGDGRRSVLTMNTSNCPGWRLSSSLCYSYYGLTTHIRRAAPSTEGHMRNSLRGIRWMQLLVAACRQRTNLEATIFV